MGDNGGVSGTSGAAPAGWHPDPDNPNGALRWWDGSRWTDHVHPVAPPTVPPPGPAPYSAGSYQQQPPWAGRRGARRGFGAGGANQASFTAIGVAVLYVLLAVTTHFVLIGIVPLLASIRAVRLREPLAPLAVVAAVVALVVGISAFAH